MSSDRFKNNPASAIEELLVLSFRNQFVDPSQADGLNFFIPEDYMIRSHKFGNLMSELVNYGLHSDLRLMEIPTILLYGENEPAVSMSGPRLDNAISNSQLLVIQNAGHFPFIERPDLFISVIRKLFGREMKQEKVEQTASAKLFLVMLY